MSLFGILTVGIALADLSAANLATPLDKIIAAVDGSPIFLSELRLRARPHFYRIDAMGGDAAARTSAKTTAMREIVERLIEERLEERAADRAHITVTPDEVDNGIRQVLAQSKLTKDELLAEVKRQGMTEQDYRDDIRRQVLEGKLLQLKVRPKIKVTDEDARKTYDTFVKETTGANAPIDLRFVVLHIEKDATPAAKAAKETLAKQIASQAQSGTDFCTLVTKHTEDATTKSTCGSRGPVPRSSLMPELAKATDALKPGETSAPIPFTDPSGAQAMLVVQRAPGPPPTLPPFEKVKEQMKERAFLEATERERKSWLAELRKDALIEMKP